MTSTLMTPEEIKVHSLIEMHVAPHGYAIVSFTFFEQDSYYRVQLDHFDKTNPITLIIFADQIKESIKNNQLPLSIAERFDAGVRILGQAKKRR